MNPYFPSQRPSPQDADRIAHDLAVCVGCEARRPTPTPTDNQDHQCPYSGRSVWVCSNCTVRAKASSEYRELLEICARTGATLVAVSKALAHLGIAEVPTTPAAVARAIEIRRTQGKTSNPGYSEQHKNAHCAACGVPVHSPNHATGDISVCNECSPHVVDDPRAIGHLWACHDKGLTLAQLAHAAGFRPEVRR